MRDATPMMAQYRALKAKHREALLLFRLGDFYELFFEDAEVGARELGITLTGRDAGNGERAPMCGVPYHSVDDYLKVLVDRGYKVAICDQMEDPPLAKGLVRREVTRVVTPGTFWEGADSSSACYIASIVTVGGTGRPGEDAGICACDLSTGEVLLASFAGDALEPRPQSSKRSAARERAVEELSKLLPRECVLPEGRRSQDLRRALERNVPGAVVTTVPAEQFSPGVTGPNHAAASGTEGSSAARVYGTATASALSGKGQGAAMLALEGLLSYLISTQKTDLGHLKEPVFYLEEGFVEIDRSTRRNLELLERLQGGREGTLAWVLDRCCTSMGSRLLKQWIQRPLRDARRIGERLDAIDLVFGDSALRENLRQELAGVKDLDRLVTRIAYKSCSARDLVGVASSLEAVAPVRALLQGRGVPLLGDILSRLDEVPEAARAVRDAIVPDPPPSVMEGYLIKEGFNPDVDELRELARGGKKWVLELEARERERTGVKSLKVGFNKVFGYYIEVTRSNLSSVPADYIRRQTLSTGERFITPELREKEAAILGAEEKLHKEEYRLFCEVRDFLWSYIRRIQKTARAVAELDVLVSLAEVALENGYARPEVAPEGDISIKDGRHPVLEKVLPPGQFVPNDLVLDEKHRILVITGPNMGGKSTYCRQTALIVLMAQMGSFVPASSCSVSCVDKLFARVGAYDDLVLGQSTFMVEMSEVSRILRGVTAESLVILDEIGRGTSTFDGLAVAWAVLEHLFGNENGGDQHAGTGGARPGPCALVATHYRELTLLADLKPGIANYNVSVRKTGDDVVFLRKVVRGVAEGSFGIEVSAMAGLPDSVVRRAREILLGLEAEARKGARWKTGILGQVASRGAGVLDESVPGQSSLFGRGSRTEGEGTSPESGAGDPAAARVPPEVSLLLEELESLEVDKMSPLEALQKLYEVKVRLAAIKSGTEGNPEGEG